MSVRPETKPDDSTALNNPRFCSTLVYPTKSQIGQEMNLSGHTPSLTRTARFQCDSLLAKSLVHLHLECYAVLHALRLVREITKRIGVHSVNGHQLLGIKAIDDAPDIGNCGMAASMKRLQ